MRGEGEPNQAIAFFFCHSNIDCVEFRVAFPIDYDSLSLAIPARKTRLVLPAFRGLFCHAHKHDHALRSRNGAGIERADHFQIVLRGFKIRRSQQAFVKQASPRAHLSISKPLAQFAVELQLSHCYHAGNQV